MAGPYTASQAMIPSGAHTGLQVNSGTVTISATTTAAAVVYLCQVPNGATIVDWQLYSDEYKMGVGQVLDLGTSACLSGLAAGFSISDSASSAVLQRNGRWEPDGNDALLPVRVSLSDDQSIDQNVWLTLKFTAAPITSLSTAIIRFNVFYTMNGMAGKSKIR